MVLQGIDFQMGDDTMTNFSGRIWQKYLVPMIVSGNVVLLQSIIDFLLCIFTDW